MRPPTGPRQPLLARTVVLVWMLATPLAAQTELITDRPGKIHLAAERGRRESEETVSGVRESLSFFTYTVALGMDVSNRWGAFVEVFGDLPVEVPGGAANSVDGGFTFLVRDNLQLDLSAGAGLTDGVPDRFLGLGLSVRIPH